VSEETTAVRFDFNGSVRLAERGEKLGGNAGALLLRETDDRLGFTAWLARKLLDPRNPVLVVHDLAALLRARLQLIALGHRDQGDADLLRMDPALRLAVSEYAGLTPLADGLGLASNPTMSRLIDILAVPTNLHHLYEGLIEGAVRCGERGEGFAAKRAVIDIDSLPIEVHVHQGGSEWSGHYGIRCFHPLVAMLDTGHWIGMELRPGNAHTAEKCIDFLVPLVQRIEEQAGHKPGLRGDAGFPSGATFDNLEASGCEYVFRIRNNSVLEELARPHLVRPAGRRPKEPREWVHDLTYKAGSWSKERRVILVVQERKGELYLHHFVLINTASKQSLSAEKLLADYRQRGTMEGHMGELKSVMAPALSCALRGENRNGGKAGDPEFRNAATMLLFALAYNLAHTARLVHVRATRNPCALAQLRKNLLTVPPFLVVSARRVTLAVNSAIAAAWARSLAVLHSVPRAA
jgi:hypothetical protein